MVVVLKNQLDEEAEIGEKGIGFKSIFAVADKISIESKYFNFSIDSTGGLINILEACDVSINEQIEENKKTNKSIKKTQIADTNFTYIEIDDDKYIMYTEMMEFEKESIILRWKHLEHDIKDGYILKRPALICFTLTNKIDNNKIKGKIYPYLPTNIELPNFPCFINLDVHLTASRGNITKEDFAEGSNWNKQVKNNLSEFIKHAYIALTKQYQQNNKNQEFQKACDDMCEIYMLIYIF